MAADGFHPAPAMYNSWASRVALLVAEHLVAPAAVATENPLAPGSIAPSEADRGGPQS